MKLVPLEVTRSPMANMSLMATILEVFLATRAITKARQLKVIKGTMGTVMRRRILVANVAWKS